MKKILFTFMALIMMFGSIFIASAFEDVAITDNYFEAINTLTSLEVIKGKTENTFVPEDLVTREQMAALLTRLYTTTSSEGGDNYTPFTDLSDPFYNYVVSWCYDAKVINGTTPTTFEPKGNIIYQDALTMVCRLLGYTDLTYPMGYTTKARLIGLTSNLDDVKFDKQLTRGETAILLYNALKAEGADVVKQNKVKYYNGFPILETVERNFEIALDVYNFKNETYQIVGTDNFYLNGYDYATNNESYYLAKVEDEIVSTTAKDYHFEDLNLTAEDITDGNILGYINILYRGDSLDDNKAIVLSSVVSSNFKATNAVAPYYKEDKLTKKLKIQKDKIAIDGKACNIEDYVYSIDENGKITAVTDLSTIPVVYQENSEDKGAYGTLVYDVNVDGKVDYIIFFPFTFEKVNKITSKGVYTLSESGSFNTEDEDTNTLIFNTEVNRDDYVITYKVGKFTVIVDVIEPTFAAVVKKSNGKYTLSNGDVVKFAEKNMPVLGLYDDKNTLELSKDNIALYIINDKIVYTESATAIGYKPFEYIYVIKDGKDETIVNTDDGSVENVYSLIVYKDGKVSTIHTDKDYSNLINTVATITKVSNGKYELSKGLNIKSEKYEIRIENGTIFYDKYAKIYKITDKDSTYIFEIDSNSEIFVEIIDENEKYSGVKRYTKTNMPTVNLGKQTLSEVVLRKELDANDKVKTYTLVCGFAQVEDDNSFADGANYENYRIVLESGTAINTDNETVGTYILLNPVNGEKETLTSKNEELAEVGDLVVVKGEKIEVISNKLDKAENITSLNKMTNLIQVDYVLNNNLIIFKDYKDTELIINDVEIINLEINDKKEFVITPVEDYDELTDKVVRIYTEENMNNKAYYIVVIPEEWAIEAGFEIE